MKKIRLNESQFNRLVAKCVKKALNEGRVLLKEGVGAGYDVELKGLNATNIQYKVNGDSIIVNAQIQPSVVDWSTNDYYYGIDSDGSYEYGLDYDSDDKKVEGGSLSVELDFSVVEYDCNRMGGVNDENIRYCLNDLFSDFSIKFMYGGGWSHSNLPSPTFSIKDCDIILWFYGSQETYEGEVSITAPNIINNINYFYEHKDDIEEINDEEEVDEEEYL